MIRCLAIALLTALAIDAIAATPSDYAFVFPIETGTSASSAWRIDLTADVYAWTQDAALGDIEVFNADGQAVPSARFLRPHPVVRRERNIALPVLALPPTADKASDLRLVIERDGDGRLRRIDAGEEASAKRASRDWLLDTSAVDAAIDSIVLDWDGTADGIVARFAIDGSVDLQSWREVGIATVVALDQNGARVQHREFPIGELRFNYLRLRRLDDGADLPALRAEARSLAPEEAHAAVEWVDADAIAPSPEDPPPAGIHRFDYTLRAALPIGVAHIELANDNALAPVTVFARDATTSPWRMVGKVNAFRVRESDDTLRNADISLARSQRYRDFRIETSAPLAAAPKLSLSYRPDSFVFLAEGKAPYSLAVGSLTTRRANYPLDDALASLRAKLGKTWQPPPASLGAALASAGADSLRPPPPPLPWRRWLLWGVLVGGALLVAGFALSLLRGNGPSSK